jgi:hypothetical protein
MRLFKRLRQFGTKLKPRANSAKRAVGFRPRLETLEDRFLPSTSPSTAWALAAGDTSTPATSLNGGGVVTDAAGNVYMCGKYTGDFVPGGAAAPLYSAGAGDVYVVKYSPTGAFLWDVSMGGPGADLAPGVAVDSAGHVDVVGGFSGTATFGSQTLTATGSGYNPFVAQLDASSGTVSWATNPFPTSAYFATHVALDSAGNAYVSGMAFYSNSFAAKVGPSGNILWEDQITKASNGSPLFDSVAVSGSNVYFAGSFNSNATISTASGNYALPESTSSVTAYVVNLTSNNQFVWAHVFQPVAQRHQNPGIVEVNSIAADGAGNVYATGALWGMVNFSGSNSTTGPFVLNGGSGAGYVVKLSSSGNAAWAEQFGNATTTSGTAVAVDLAGNVYLTGSYSGTSSFFGTYVTGNAGSTDVFVAKLTTNGALQCVVSAGGSGQDLGSGITIDNSGNIDVTGYIDTASAANYTAMFDPTHRLQTSTEVAFLWKLTQP